MRKPKMKVLRGLVVASVLIVSSTIATAQGSFVASNGQAAATSASVFEADNVAHTSKAAVVVSENISRKFTKELSGATNVVWGEANNGFMVRFTSQEGILNLTFLTKKGAWLSTIRYYTEKELPATVRHEVKSKYYDFAITSVKEVRYNETTAYLVTIADAGTWKVIRVADGETSVWEEHVKG